MRLPLLVATLVATPALASEDPDTAFWEAFVARGQDVEGTLQTRLEHPHRLGERAGGDMLDAYRWGHLSVLVDTEGEWYDEALGRLFTNPESGFEWVLGSVEEAFYRDHGDEYDYITVLMVRDLGLFGAFYSPMANDVHGIGYDVMSATETFDTSLDTQLEGFIFMNYVGLWSQNPEAGRFVFAQEFMHRWGAFVNVDHDDLGWNDLLGRDNAHWSYWLDTGNSPMEGNGWIDNGDGTWTVDVDLHATYSPLDMYLMGLAGPDDVPDMTYLMVSPEVQDDVNRDPGSNPENFAETLQGVGVEVTVPATATTVSIDDIIAAEGARVPAADASPHEFRMAFVVVALEGDPTNDTTLAGVDDVRLQFEADWEADVGNTADLITELGDTTAEFLGNDITDDGSDDDEEAPKACGCTTGGVAQAAWLLPLAVLGLRRRRSFRVNSATS